MTGDFRFGVNMMVPDSRAAWVDKCRKAEDLGYDVLSAADHLERTITELKRRYADPEHKPAPTRPQGPPLLLGGRGDRILPLAAEHADTIGFTGTAKTPDGAALAPATAEGIEERVKFVRSKLGDRQAEFNLLVHFVTITGNRKAALEEFEGTFRGLMTVDQLAELPTVLAGTPAEVAEQVRAHRERFGLTYFTVLEQNMTQFAPVLEHLR